MIGQRIFEIGEKYYFENLKISNGLRENVQKTEVK
jgi:hypothetical protein